MPAKKKKHVFREDHLIQERHPRGAQALYDMYSASLFGVISRIVPDNGISEDTLQDTFVRIWDSFDKYDPEKGRLFTWMVNIARHLAIDQLRSKGYRKSLITQELSGDEDVYVLADTVYNRIDLAILKTAARLLRPEEQAVLALVYGQGFTHLEAAERLGIPLGTVKTRLVMAIRQLRAYDRERPVIRQTA